MEIRQNSGLEAQTNNFFLAPLIAKVAIVKRFAQVGPLFHTEKCVLPHYVASNGYNFNVTNQYMGCIPFFQLRVFFPVSKCGIQKVMF